jgi:hypothetical protein
MGCTFADSAGQDIVFGTWRRDREFPRTGVATLAGSAFGAAICAISSKVYARAELARIVDRRKPSSPPPCRS